MKTILTSSEMGSLIIIIVVIKNITSALFSPKTEGTCLVISPRVRPAFYYTIMTVMIAAKILEKCQSSLSSSSWLCIYRQSIVDRIEHSGEHVVVIIMFTPFSCGILFKTRLQKCIFYDFYVFSP